MNRFVGLSGILHLSIFAGIIYFCATYDYSAPNQLSRLNNLERAELDLKASGAASSPEVALDAQPDSQLKTQPNAQAVISKAPMTAIPAKSEISSDVKSAAASIDYMIEKNKTKTENLQNSEKGPGKNLLAKMKTSAKSAPVSKALPKASFAPRKEVTEDMTKSEDSNSAREGSPSVTETTAQESGEKDTNYEIANEKVSAQSETPQQTQESEQVASETQNNKETNEYSAADEKAALAQKQQEIEKAAGEKAIQEKKAFLAKLKALNEQNAKAAAQAKEQSLAASPSGSAAHADSPDNSTKGANNGNSHSESEIRGIEDLRQANGNPIPVYDTDDRLKGRQGTVVFHTFVNKDGKTKDFELVESTGHRTLDLKTLKALKEWKFEPGQEGWVEIPFRWDLKGGASELPSKLRKKLSQKPDSLISK